MSNLTEEDLRQLDKTQRTRERMIDHLTEKELPSGPRDVEVLTSLLDSTDKQIFSKAKLKLEEASNQASEATKQIMMELLTTMHSQPHHQTTKNIERTDLPSFNPTGLSVDDGEVIGGKDHITYEDAIEQLDEASFEPEA